MSGNQLLEASVSFSPTPHTSYQAGDLRVVREGDTDWLQPGSNLLGAFGIDPAPNNFTSMTGWNASAGSTAQATIDAGSAISGDEFVVRGYWGDSDIHRPTAAHLEWSDDNSAWTTVDNFTGLTASSSPGGRGWVVVWDTSGESHRYWRITLTHGGTWLHVGSFYLGNHWQRNKVGAVTESPAAHGSYPNRAISFIRSGDSDWATTSSTLVFGGRAMGAEIFTPGYVGINQSAGQVATYTLDNRAAVSAKYLYLKGYTGTDAIGAPTQVVIEYSDDNSAWTTHETKSTLSDIDSVGQARWWYICDIEGETHRYWRALLTHVNSWMFVSTFELVDFWENLALARPYTISPSADGNFPNAVLGYHIFPGDSDWVSGHGKLTDGETGTYAVFGTGVGWFIGTGATATVRVDLGSAQPANHILIHGIHGNGTNMITPLRVQVEWSDDDSAWTSVFDEGSLATDQNNFGRWIAKVDVSGDGSHRYWRTILTQETAGLFLTMTQFEVWATIGAGVTAVGKDLALEWDVNTLVNDTLQLVWDTTTTSAIGDTVEFVWDVGVAAGDPVALRWDIEAAVGDTAQLVWDVLTAEAIGDTISLLWDVTGFVGDELQLVWGVEVNVVSTFIGWGIPI